MWLNETVNNLVVPKTYINILSAMTQGHAQQKMSLADRVSAKEAKRLKIV